MGSLLNELSEEDRALLISLPYRVGLFISASDKSGGIDADQKELAAISTIVTSYVEDTCKSEFAQSVMESTLAQSNQWNEWRANIQQVPNECEQVVDMLLSRVDRKDLESFKLNLVEIGTTVAMAYREFDENQSASNKIIGTIVVGLEKVKALLGGRSEQSNDELFNISRAEKEALNILSAKLKVNRGA